MSTTRTPTRGFLNALLALVAAGMVAAATQAAPPKESKEGKDTLLPGAKLLHKFSHKVYRIPALMTTDKGTRLLVWVDAFDPTPVRRFPHEPLPDPVFDLIVWDVAANKELYKMSYPKEGAPYSPADPTTSSVTTSIPFGSLALAPDGRQLAYMTTTHKMVPGKVEHEATTHVKLFDPDARKSRQAVSTEYKGHPRPQLLFAPDGALVILTETSCRVVEPGKDKPRASFELERAPVFKTNPGSNVIRDGVLSSDGSRMAVAADGLVTVYDVAAGKKVFQSSRVAPEAKTTFGQVTGQVALAFAPSPSGQKLLAVEVIVGPPKSFALARVFDLKEKKEAGRHVLAEQETRKDALAQTFPQWGRSYTYFTAQGEPRVVFDGKLIDGAGGKVLEKFDPRAGVLVSRDGKYLVRLTRKNDEKTMGVEVWGLDYDSK
jgi:hypothetical protein